MSSAIRVRFLENHGATVRHDTPAGPAERFVRPGEGLTVAEAAAALGTYKTKVRRLVAAGILKRWGKGEPFMIRIGDVRRVLGEPSVLADRRTTRHQSEAVA